MTGTRKGNMLSFDDITFAYPGASSPVLDGVSLSVGSGECVVLAGSNGSGKSTLAKLACGFLVPDSGSVDVDGLPTADKASLREIRRKVGIVAQDPAAQIVASSVADEVAFGPENLGLPRDEIERRVGESIRTCGLQGREHREPHTLSGGEQQRLAIAGVLAMRPSYLVLDEPCAMLDPTGRREVMQLVERLRGAGHGILLITHDVDEMMSADRVVALKGGCVRFDGPPQLLLADGLVDELGMDLSPMLELALAFRAHGVEMPARPADPGSLAAAVGVRSTAVDGGHDHGPWAGSDAAGTAGGILEARHVTYTYAAGTPLEHRALEDILVRMGSGEMVLVLGATGSGKSTLLSLLAGLIAPDGGVVSLGGHDVVPGEVGLVFQRPERQLFADTVLDDVAFGPGNLGHDTQAAHDAAVDALGQMGVDVREHGQRSPFSLSGGEARRVAIAGIIAMHPPFMLFDEPSAGLDAAGRGDLLRLIAGLKEGGRGIMVVSHDVDTFLMAADRVVFLEGGRVSWQGPVRDLIRHPGAFTRAGLELPGLLAFQRMVGIADPDLSYDIDRIVDLTLGMGDR